MSVKKFILFLNTCEMQIIRKKQKSITHDIKIQVIWLNKPTSTSKNEHEKIHYQKIKYKIVQSKKLSWHLKLQYSKISLSHKKDYPQRKIKDQTKVQNFLY